MSDRDFWVQCRLTHLLVCWYASSFFELFCFVFWDLQPMTPRQNWPISFCKLDSYVLLTNNASREIDDDFSKGCWNISHLPPTIVLVTLATKDETSRGVAKACLLSVTDVGSILQVVVSPRKPRWRLTVFIQITKTKTNTITKTITIVNWNYNNIIRNAWIYLNWCVRHERNALRAYVDNAIKITTINVN